MSGSFLVRTSFKYTFKTFFVYWMMDVEGTSLHFTLRVVQDVSNCPYPSPPITLNITAPLTRQKGILGSQTATITCGGVGKWALLTPTDCKTRLSVLSPQSCLCANHWADGWCGSASNHLHLLLQRNCACVRTRATVSVCVCAFSIFSVLRSIVSQL